MLREGNCRAKLPLSGRVPKVICCTSLAPVPPATKEVMVAVTAVLMAVQLVCSAAGVVSPMANLTELAE
jgi:hypothetical protein